ncbi:FAD-binding oxidoreductase, partial [Streptomyces sp. GbtcB6]|uniref:FAD-binding oxidoreductase n=1 Tax=Streptomyces sp. GbtcB6 TaxID=2824751 RepID=UPI001C2FA087
MPAAHSAAAAAQTPVGVWAARLRHDDRADVPLTLSLASDGTLAMRAPTGVGTGSWSTGPHGGFTCEFTETPVPAGGGRPPVRIRAEARLDETGRHGTGSMHTADGVPVHTSGGVPPRDDAPAEFTAERLAAEPAVWHDLVGLGGSVRGPVLHPGDDGFEEACSGWLLTVEQRPAVVVVAADADDVAAAVRFAARAGRPLAVQSTGHGASVSADGAVFVVTGELRELSVDPEAGTARIGAGLRWGEVVTAAAEHGLAPLCGSSEGVGVMGYLTGGGLPLACRTYGFAAGHVRSLDIVTADGRRRTVSPAHEPGLFWADRGGKGNYGAVGEAEIE